MTATELITRIYIGYFNRVPDVAGMSYWREQYDAGLSLQQIINAFARSEESLALYGDVLALGSAPDGTRIETFINSVYLNLFNRDAEPAGLEYWRSQILGEGIQSSLPLESAILTIMQGALGNDSIVLANKLAASGTILERMLAQELSLPVEQLIEVLSQVTSVPDSIEQAIDSAFPPEPPMNAPPQPRNDMGFTEGNIRISVPASDGVLINDTDPDGDPLRVTAVDGRESSVDTFVEGSRGGLFKLSPDGSYLFYPMGAFEELYPGQEVGTSVFYTVDDGQGGVATAILTVFVTGVRAGTTGSEPAPEPISPAPEDPVTPPADRYEITLRYDSGAQAYAQYFESAASRLEAIVREGLPDTFYGSIAVDDLLIDASVRNIDGWGNTLGYAGPEGIRPGGLPYYGSMVFDSADIDDLITEGLLGDVIVHEMLHVLGFGTLWDSRGLVSGSVYTGINAVEAYRDLTGNNTLNVIPLTTGEGEGSDLAHWDEDRFSNELMTPFIDYGNNPLSTLTVGALEDLGYVVNYAAADSYSLLG